ncbi:MAG: hemolysin family protein [Patescibacteria group bacterium]
MQIIIFIILIALVAFFAAAETAFFSLHGSRVRLLKKRKALNANMIEKLKKHPERLLTTVLIGNTLANLSTATYATALAVGKLGSFGLGIVTGLTVIVVLIVGEIIPKSIAYADNVRVAQITAYPLYLFSILVWPLSAPLNGLHKRLNRLLGAKHAGQITEDEVLIMSRMSVEKGGIGYDELEFIEKVFKFDDITVGSAMTAFPRIHFLDGEVPVENIAHYISKTEHSRYPVYKGSDKNIIGYIHVNSVMKALNSDDRDKPIMDFVSKIQKIDEEVSLERAFRAMNKRGAHMYLVHAHKDPAKVVGLITLEDILEELVGEIEDETDIR